MVRLGNFHAAPRGGWNGAALDYRSQGPVCQPSIWQRDDMHFQKAKGKSWVLHSPASERSVPFSSLL